jgi:hypothetical protein
MNFKQVISWAMVASVFMDDFIILRRVLPFDFYYYYITFIVSILYYIKITGSLKLLPRWFAIAITVLILTTFSLTFIENTYSLSVMKQIVGLIFTSIAYYTFLAYNNFEVKRLFRMYVFLAFLVSLEGLMEEAFNLSGIRINRKFRLTDSGFYRIFGIMGEPYFLAVTILPALNFVFYKSSIFERVNTMIVNLILLFVIGICFIFTFSSAGFLGIAGVFGFWLYNKNYLTFKSWKILLLPMFVLLFGVFFNNVQKQWKEFNIKFNQTVSAFANNSTKKEDINNLNTSSFALYSNFVIAKESFSKNPLTGSGLGTHESNYEKYFSKYFDEDFIVRYGVFNTADANSMFVRLMSETGLMGLGMFFLFMFRFFVMKKGYKDPILRDYVIINQSIFIWMIVRLVRTGNYFGNGFFLFFFMYYLTYKLIQHRKKQLSNYSNSNTLDIDRKSTSAVQ